MSIFSSDRNTSEQVQDLVNFLQNPAPQNVTDGNITTTTDSYTGLSPEFLRALETLRSNILTDNSDSTPIMTPRRDNAGLYESAFNDIFIDGQSYEITNVGLATFGEYRPNYSFDVILGETDPPDEPSRYSDEEEEEDLGESEYAVSERSSLLKLNPDIIEKYSSCESLDVLDFIYKK